MIAALASMFGDALPWIVGILAAVLAGFGFNKAGKDAGKAEAHAEAAAKQADEREAIAVRQVNEARAGAAKEIETVQGASDVQKSNAALSADDVHNRLRDEYQRD